MNDENEKKQELNETKTDESNEAEEQESTQSAQDEEITVEEQLEAAEKKAEETYNRLLYLQADFENYKKRAIKEKEGLLKFGNEKTILAFLPAIDNLALALESAQQAKDVKAIVEGLEMTYKNLMGIFENMGCEFVESLGQSFDPNVHEAVMHQENADVDANMVIEEFQKGCLLHGRLLRPAKVVVSKEHESN